MTIKKSFYLRALSLVVAFLLTFTTVMVFPTNVFAYTKGDDGRYYLEEDEVTISDILLNGTSVSKDPNYYTPVSPGDKLTFNFEWKLNKVLNYVVDDKLVFPLDQLKNLNIPQNMEIQNVVVDGITTCEYTIKNGELIITIKEGLKDQLGWCSFSGTLDITDAAVKDGGKFDLNLGEFGGPFYFDVSDYMAKLKVEKTYTKKDNADIGDAIYQDNDGNYYIDYSVTVTSYEGDSTDVWLQDTLYGNYGKIVDIFVNGKKAELDTGSDNNSSNGRIFIGDVKKDHPVVVTYRVQLNSQNESEIITKGLYQNHVEAKSKYSHDTDDEYVKTGAPGISKSGKLLDDGTIEWIIYIYPGSYADNNTNFTLSDILDNQVSKSDAGTGINRKTFEEIFGTSSNEITAEQLKQKGFWNDNEKRYEITYYTKVNDGILDKNAYSIKNQTDVDFKDGTKLPAEATVTGSKELDVNKYLKRNGDNFTWTIIIDIPENISGINELYVEDGFVSSDGNLKIENVEGSIKITGITKGKETETISNNDIGYWLGSGGWWVRISKSEILEKYKGGEIYIEYKSKSTTNEPITGHRNKAHADLTFEDGTMSGDDNITIDDAPVGPVLDYNYHKVSSMVKNSNGLYSVQWLVGVSDPDLTKCLHAGDKIEITDVIPEGHVLDRKSVEVYSFHKTDAADDALNIWNAGINVSIKPDTDITPDNNTYTFTFTLPSNHVDINSSYAGYGVVYTTTVTEEEYQEILKNGKKTYTNNAHVTITDANDYTESADVTADRTISASDLVSKNGEVLISNNTSQDEFISKNYGSVKYTIDINPNRHKLNPYDGTLIATDHLGQKLKFDDDKPVEIKVVTEWGGSWPEEPDSDKVKYNVSDDKQTITFTLEDETYYQITYYVKVEPISIEKDESGKDVTGADNSWVSNRIGLVAGGGTYYSDDYVLGWSEFQSSSGYQATPSKMKITLSKYWENDTAGEKTIKIQLYRNTYDSSGQCTVPDELIDTAIITKSSGSDASDWQNMIIFDELPRITSNTTYSYYIKEIFDNGTVGEPQNVSYEYVQYNSDTKKTENIDIVNPKDTTFSKDAHIVIKNTYTVPIDIVVEKLWDDEGHENTRPDVDDILFQLYDNDSAVGEPIKLTDDGNNKWTGKWENLPSSGKYTIKEVETPAGYTSSGTATVSKAKNGNYYIGTITNKYSPDTIDILLTKEWKYGIHNDKSTTPKTSDLKFIVTAHVDGKEPWNVTISKDNIIVSEDGKTVTFKGLPKYDGDKEIKYTIKEDPNSLPTGYIPSGDATSDNGYKITNTYETVDITLTKVWTNDTDPKFEKSDKPETSALKFIITAKVGDKTWTVLASSYTKSVKGDTVTFKGLPKYDGKSLIEYIITEDSTSIPKGYVPSGDATATDGNGYKCTITNKYDVTPTKTISVQKTWHDDGNKLGERPSEVTIKLLQNGNEFKTVNLSKDNSWKHTWTGLPVNDKNNKPYEYTIKEDPVPANYICEISSETTEDGYTTNFYVDNTYKFISVTAYKLWDDEDSNGNAPADRPTEITVQLYRDYAPYDGKEVKLSETSGWSYTWNNLPVSYKNGDEYVNYVYEVVEKNEFPNYSIGRDYQYVKAGEDGTEEVVDPDGVYDKIKCYITNTRKHKTVSVQKHWVDNNDAEGKRPDQIEVQLLQNGNEYATAVLDKENDWSYEWTDLPFGDKDGNEYIYDVHEDTVEGYQQPNIVKTPADNPTYFDIYNTYIEKPKTKVSVTKVWLGDDDNTVHNAVEINLLADGAVAGNVTLDDSNHWTYTWENLNAEDDNSKPIIYTVEEVNVPSGYTVSYYDSRSASDDGTNWIVANTYGTSSGEEISVSKVWFDNNDAAGKRPTSIEVNLYQRHSDGTNEVLYQSVTLSSSNNWRHTWKVPLKSDDESIEYKYRVEEDLTNVNRYYYRSAVTVAGNNHIITNTYKAQTVSVEKNWLNDNNNKDGTRPTQLAVQLKRDGIPYGGLEYLTEAGNWSYTWTNLPYYQDNTTDTPSVYTVEEVPVDGYTPSDPVNPGTNKNNFVISNRYQPKETKTISVQKFWENETDPDNTRPEEITVKLVRQSDGETVETAKLNKSNGWKHTWTGLDKDIMYTVEEVSVNGYASSKPVRTADTPTRISFAITNTYKTKDISVKKNWENETDPDNTRPEEITVKLVRQSDGETIDTAKLNEANDWYFKWTKLPREDDKGNTIMYTVQEISVKGYKSGKPVRTAEGNTKTNFVITNTYNAPEDIEIIKTYTYTNLATMDSDDRDDLLSNTEFTLTDKTDPTNTFPVENPQWIGGKAVVTFKGSGLKVGHTYELQETKSPDGYDRSDKVYTCVISSDEDGTVTYMLDGKPVDFLKVAYENAKIEEKINIEITKKWLNSDDTEMAAEEIPVSYIKANVYYDGNLIEEVTINDTTWHLEREYENTDDRFTNVTKFDPDKFTVKEVKYFGGFTISDEKTGETSFTITNKASSEPSISLIKTFKSNGTVDTDTSLVSTFGLYGKYENGTLSEKVGDSKPAVWEDNRAVVTFTENDGIETGKTYYLKEESANGEYGINDNVYVCRIDDNGKVEYKLSTESNSAFSIWFPECVNIKAVNAPGPETPENPSTPTDPSVPSEITPVAPGVKPLGEDISSGAEIYAESDIFGGNRFKAAMIISSLMVVVVAFAESFIIRIWKKKKSMKH